MVNENTIKIVNLDILGKLPNPFMFDDGKIVNTKEDWDNRKKEIFKTAVELQYGTIPPKPEVLKVDTLYTSPINSTYRITCGTKEKQLSFRLKLLLPKEEKNCPIIVDGDLCFHYITENDFISTATSNGIGWALFDRTELANDVMFEGRRHGLLYDIYKDYSFGAIGAWAWGYSVVCDALEIIKHDRINLDFIVFTGHSRGAKTAMLAGVLDERAKIVNPNESCAGSCGCYRIHMTGEEHVSSPNRSETLDDLMRNFGYWMGEGMEEYRNREKDLPFDTHFLKALVAPRILFVSEASYDLWSNPVGSLETTLAAKEVFKFLECENNIYWYYREGQHYHNNEDISMLINLILHKTKNEKLNPNFFNAPFKREWSAFDFSADNRLV